MMSRKGPGTEVPAPSGREQAREAQASSRAAPWSGMIRNLAADRVDRGVFVAVTLIVGFAYSILLPFDYTQRISIANWHYFGPRYAAFTVAFALGMGLLVTLQVYAMRCIVRNSSDAAISRRTGPLGALAAAGSLLPSFLCCSPLIPTLVGLLGLSASVRLHTSARLEYFFATKMNLLLGGALALLVASVLWSLRKLARASCLDDQSCQPKEAK